HRPLTSRPGCGGGESSLCESRPCSRLSDGSSCRPVASTFRAALHRASRSTAETLRANHQVQCRARRQATLSREGMDSHRAGPRLLRSDASLARLSRLHGRVPIAVPGAARIIAGVPYAVRNREPRASRLNAFRVAFLLFSPGPHAYAAHMQIGVRRTVVAILVAAAVSGCIDREFGVTDSQSIAPTLNADDDSAVRAIVAKFADTWNRHDMNAMHALDTEDVEWINVTANHWRGKAAVYKGHDTIHRTIFAKTDMIVLDTTARSLAPGVAVVVATMKFGPV